MAQQSGILGIRGTVGGLVFAKDGSIRQKPASNKASFNSSASMARTRENASEFAEAASSGKLLRDALRATIQTASDSKMVSRLTQKMREIIGFDEDNDRGGRMVLKDNIAGLLGFNFNVGAGISQSLFFGYAVSHANADVTLNISGINPQTDITAPQGATHYEVVFGAAALNFEAKTYTSGAVAAPLGVQALAGPVVAAQAVTATLSAAPTVEETVIAVLGINFYQQLNGKYYPLNNNGSNPLAIGYVA
ncbi:hypothetical protein [Hymenobacter sp.]|jgi:hypothetical protein|uniref:hypothetical protein n=1 Tax=Hymenobacter sp. TaxID=1898978 RepID=UPI002EDAE9D9